MSVLDPASPFSQLLPDEEAAVVYFTARRWRNGEHCPYCDHRRLYRWATRSRYSCPSCRHTFSIKTGTLFHNSSRPLRHWLAVIWLATNAEKGLTIRKVSDELRVSAGAAASMLSCLRHATRAKSFAGSKATTAGGHSATQLRDHGVVGHHYERKLKRGMSFDDAVDRFADVSRREIEAGKADSLRLRRVQKSGWRGSVRLTEVEVPDVDDDLTTIIVPTEPLGAD